MSSDTSGIAQRFGSGREVRRLGDEGLLKGLGRYTDDISADGRAAAGVRALSLPACAHRRRSTRAAARSMPGVLAVMTGADLVAAGVKPMPGSRRLQARRTATPAPRPRAACWRMSAVRFVGEAVALVVAQTLQQARDAAEAVAVEYEELPHVTDPVAATAPGAPLMCDEAPDNIAAESRHGDADGRAAAFAQAAMWWSCTSSTSGWSPCRSSRAPCWPGSPNDGPAHVAHEHPDAFGRARLAVQGHPRAADRTRCA